MPKELKFIGFCKLGTPKKDKKIWRKRKPYWKRHKNFFFVFIVKKLKKKNENAKMITSVCGFVMFQREVEPTPPPSPNEIPSPEG